MIYTFVKQANGNVRIHNKTTNEHISLTADKNVFLYNSNRSKINANDENLVFRISSSPNSLMSQYSMDIPYNDIDFDNCVPVINNTTPIEVLDQLTEVFFLGGSGGDSIYSLMSPTNITVGALTSGTDITGLSLSEIIQMMVIAYLAPTFNVFNIIGQQTLIEVGNTIIGNRTFTWTNTNVANIIPNSILIRDSNLNITLIEDLPVNSNIVYDFTPAIEFNTAMTKTWQIRGTNSNNQIFSRNFSVQSIFPYFWGKVSSSGAMPGDNRPVANNALINSGTKIVAQSTGTLTINFNSTNDDYIWFAIPETSASKTKWFESILNNGDIGGAVDVGGNLFPSPQVINIDSPTLLWNNIPYKIYISNYQTQSNTNIELRNS